MKLYNYWRSSCSWRVRIALNWKGMKFEYEPVHLVQGNQNSAEYLEKNPMRTVPMLEWYDELGNLRRLSQSLAILEYLEEMQPEPRLLPAEPLARASARMLAEVINSGIQPLQNLSVMQAVAALKGDDKAWSKGWIERGLGALEALVKDTAGTYCVRNQVTFADVFLVPQLYNARRFGVDMARLPILTGIEKACAALPAFQASHPDRQPDANK